MKCINCPCSCVIPYFDGDDWECLADKEWEVQEDSDGDCGCDLTEQEAKAIAEKAEDDKIKYIEGFEAWSKEEDT